MFVLYNKTTGKVLSFQRENTFTKADVGQARALVNRPWPPGVDALYNREYRINPADVAGAVSQVAVESLIELEFNDGKTYKVDLNDPDRKPVRRMAI